MIKELLLANRVTFSFKHVCSKQTESQ